MRNVVGERARDTTAASTSEIGRFETETLAFPSNLSRLMDLCGQWIDRAHSHRKLTRLVLDMDSSVSETYGRQQGSAYDASGIPSIRQQDVMVREGAFRQLLEQANDDTLALTTNGPP
jgi:hypothetical protein